jgi:hypothetical protein
LIFGLSACASSARQQAPQPTAAPQVIVQTQVVTINEQVAAVGATGAPATAAPIADSNAPGDPQLSFAPVGSGLVIKDAELELLVSNTDRAMNQVTQMTGDSGGYIISSQTWYVDGFKFASLKLGIPSANFEQSLTYLRGLAVQILRENATGQDVSAEYTDLQSQLVNLEATAARVREFLADAKTVEESLRINGQLSELEVQIETIKGQMRFYEGRAAYSTVTVFLTPQYPTPTPSLTPTPTQTPTNTPTSTPTATPTSWSPGTTFDEASGVLVSMTQTTVDALIWVAVVGGPIILIFGLILGGARFAKRK